MYPPPESGSVFASVGLLHEPFSSASKVPFPPAPFPLQQASQVSFAAQVYRVQELRDGQRRERAKEAHIASMRTMADYYGLPVALSLAAIVPGRSPRLAHNLLR